MKHALLLLALPAHAAQISTEVSHMGQPESRWMRSEASMREEDEWWPSAQVRLELHMLMCESDAMLPATRAGALLGAEAILVLDPFLAPIPILEGLGWIFAVTSFFTSFRSPSAVCPKRLRAPGRAAEAEAETKKFFERLGLQTEYGVVPNNSDKQTSKLLQSRFVDHGFWMGPRRSGAVAKETGLPLNSSEAAQKEEEEKAEAKEAEEEEEAERFDALYAGIALVILLAAGGTFYFHRRSQQKLDKLKPGEVRSGPARRAGTEGDHGSQGLKAFGQVPTVPTAAPSSAPPEDPSAPGPAEAEGKAATGS
ncbi:LZTR1 [Symbiodinium sp. CCMP2592]|nr:LZTR1 [Symbiodinium sp. CCMP2592]